MCVMGATLQMSKSVIVLVTMSYDKSPPTQGLEATPFTVSRVSHGL